LSTNKNLAEAANNPYTLQGLFAAFLFIKKLDWINSIGGILKTLLFSKKKLNFKQCIYFPGMEESGLFMFMVDQDKPKNQLLSIFHFWMIQN
jgi:hypothetical protein